MCGIFPTNTNKQASNSAGDNSLLYSNQFWYYLPGNSVIPRGGLSPQDRILSPCQLKAPSSFTGAVACLGINQRSHSALLQLDEFAPVAHRIQGNTLVCCKGQYKRCQVRRFIGQRMGKAVWHFYALSGHATLHELCVFCTGKLSKLCLWEFCGDFITQSWLLIDRLHRETRQALFGRTPFRVWKVLGMYFFGLLWGGP